MAVAFDFFSHLIFPTYAVAKAGPLPSEAEQLRVQTPDGATLHGVYLRAADSTKSARLILGFGGNAWNGQDVAEYLRQVFPDEAIVAFHYRGYTPSSGTASAEALIADAPLIYDAAVKHVKPSCIIAVGLSIGSGVAARLSAARKLDGLILVTPFDSLKAVAGSIISWLPIGALFRQDIDAAGALAKSDVKIAIIAAENDEIVSAARTNALRKTVRNLVFDRTIANAGHNDIYARSEFHNSMREALARLAGER
jgi:pimeloyl-ACP methyl ester carboxylesterase